MTIQEVRNQITIQKVNRMIFVNFRKEGIHCYPGAAPEPALESVNFLQYPHRHEFWFKVAIEVTHNDRDIEFIIFKRWLESLYSSNTLQLDYKSCEMIADDLYSQISQKYPNRNVEITVSEDGENGATIFYHKIQP